MIKTENETRVPVTRNFRLLGFVFLVLALSFGKVAANAAPQVPERSAGKTACRIANINLKTGVVTANVIAGSPAPMKDFGGGQSFRFFVKDAALLNSLKEGEQIFADFKTQEVFTSAGSSGQIVRMGSILTGNFGKPSAGGANQQPAKFGEPVGPVDGGRPAGPVDGAKLGPVDGATLQAQKPDGPAGGANLQPYKIGPVDAAHPAGPGGANLGPIDGGRPIGPIDGAKLGPVDGAKLGPVDGAKLGNAANPGQPNCQITGINAATGVVSAKDLSTGQTFQFTVKDSALFRSFKMGQRFFVNFNSRQASLDGKNFTGIQSVGGALPN